MQLLRGGFPESVTNFRSLDEFPSPRSINIHLLEYELAGLDRPNFKNCGGGPVEDLAMLVHLVLAILSVLKAHDGVRTVQRGVVRVRRRRYERAQIYIRS